MTFVKNKDEKLLFEWLMCNLDKVATFSIFHRADMKIHLGDRII